MTHYGILDDFGAVIKWQSYKPSDTYTYITKRIAKKRINLNDYEEALL